MGVGGGEGSGGAGAVGWGGREAGAAQRAAVEDQEEAVHAWPVGEGGVAAAWNGFVAGGTGVVEGERGGEGLKVEVSVGEEGSCGMYREAEVGRSEEGEKHG